MNQDWINLDNYTVAEHVVFATGCLLWVVVYFNVIRDIYTKQFCGIPPITVGANITWEFLKSFVYPTDMGLFYILIYKIWFFLDLYIAYGSFKYGDKLVAEPIKKYFKLIMTFNLIVWLIAQYLFMKMGYDDVVGAFSAFIINVVISGMYISIVLTTNYLSNFTKTVAWAKMFGTGLVGVFAFMHWSENYLLLTLGIVIFTLDAFYLYLLYSRKSQITLLKK